MAPAPTMAIATQALMPRLLPASCELSSTDDSSDVVHPMGLGSNPGRSSAVPPRTSARSPSSPGPNPVVQARRTTRAIVADRRCADDRQARQTPGDAVERTPDVSCGSSARHGLSLRLGHGWADTTASRLEDELGRVRPAASAVSPVPRIVSQMPDEVIQPSPAAAPGSSTGGRPDPRPGLRTRSSSAAPARRCWCRQRQVLQRSAPAPRPHRGRR